MFTVEGESIVGPQGPPGPRGRDGLPGVSGLKGEKGESGHCTTECRGGIDLIGQKVSRVSFLFKQFM